MSDLLELIGEQIKLREERLSNLEEQLENLREMERLAGSLNGDLSTSAVKNATETKKVPKRRARVPAERPQGSRAISIEAIADFARRRGQVKSSDVMAEFRVAKQTASIYLAKLVNAGTLERLGSGRATHYRPKGSVPAPTEKRRQEPTLEGRVAAAIGLPRTAPEVAARLDVDLADVEAELKRLVNAGEAEWLMSTNRYRICK